MQLSQNNKQQPLNNSKTSYNLNQKVALATSYDSFSINSAIITFRSLCKSPGPR